MISHNNMVTIANKKLLYNIWTHYQGVKGVAGGWRGVAGGCEGRGRRV